MTTEFDDIRPYDNEEMKPAMNELLDDQQFALVLKGLAPWLPRPLRNALIRTAFIGIHSPLDFQMRFMCPLLCYLLHKCADGISFAHPTILPGEERYTFVSNHRDIVLDSALLSLMLHREGFPTTCEIGIGDNLLIYPWIKKLVKMNKAFTVRRGLSPRELLESSQLMSRYMHHAIQVKKENIWIAQREGRAKDSSDHTQESVLKMMAMGGEGTPLQRLAQLNIVPLTISYEYDPCDYLKAREMQQKRDNPSYRKTKQDDLDNMKTGIWGYKGHIHYEAAPCINAWLPELEQMPKAALFAEVARRMDLDIHRGYRLFPGNYIALDMLHRSTAHSAHYTPDDERRFHAYLDQRLSLIDLPEKDVPFLLERMLEMYANPVLNQEKASR